MAPPDSLEGTESAIDLNAVASGEDACPACGCAEVQTLLSGTDQLYHTTDRIFYMVQCPRCGLMRMYPKPTPSELHRYYPENYWYIPGRDPSGPFAEYYRRFVLSDHVRFVWKAIENSGEKGVVLDVGCGGGLFLSMLADRGLKVVGLDFALSAASAAWKANQVPALCGSLTNAPIREASCAAVTMFHVLEHLYDPAAYLDEARRILRPNGRLIVQVPNADCWQFLLFGERWNGVDIPRHLIHFRARDLQTLLEDCGFELVREKHFSWRDNPAGLATTLAPGLDPMARRIRRVNDSPRLTVFKDVLYLGLVALSWPAAIFEAACRRGSSIMVEAKKRP